MINVITRDDLTEPMGVGNYVLTYPEDTMNSK